MSATVLKARPRRLDELMGQVGYSAELGVDGDALVVTATPLANAIPQSEFRRLLATLAQRMGIDINVNFSVRNFYAPN